MDLRQGTWHHLCRECQLYREWPQPLMALTADTRRRQYTALSCTCPGSRSLSTTLGPSS
jgi:hypothetical protein